MNGFYALDVKDYLLSATVRLTCTVQTEFTLSGVKAKKNDELETAALRRAAIRQQPYKVR